LFRLRQQRSGTHSGAGFSKRRFIGIHHAQVQEAQIAHGPRSRTNIQRIARRYQHDTETIEIGRRWQDELILAGSQFIFIT
jgi:hypothetical protein